MTLERSSYKAYVYFMELLIAYALQRYSYVIAEALWTRIAICNDRAPLNLSISFNYLISKLKCFSSPLVVVFTQSVEARC